MSSVISQASSPHPTLKDYWFFYLAIPFGLAVIFAIFGIRLIIGMPFLDGFIYTVIHLMAAWWGIDIGCRITRWCFSSWQPPVQVIIVIGFFVMLVPLTFFYQWLGGVYAGHYPSFAEARRDPVAASWSLEYLLHFLRFSVTALPIFMAGFFGYRLVSGVDWYAYDHGDSVPEIAYVENGKLPRPADEQPCAKLFADCSLPAEAVVMAVKAEEHYIRIWSDQGAELIRFRFQDALDLLAPYAGLRTHRSWWINPESVMAAKKKGRSLELELNNELTVPVSLAYKEVVNTEFKNLVK